MAPESLAHAPACAGCYEIVNALNGKRYVGSAVNLRSRWNGHRCRLIAGKHHSRHLQAAWDRDGEGAFTFRALLVCERDALLLYEQILLDATAPEYNVLRVAGNSLGRKATEETKAKIAAKAIGRKRSAESIERGSAARRGVPLAPGHAAKLIGNRHAQGLRHTEEWKAANSVRNLGVKRPKDAAYRAKISDALKGRKATPEQRAKQSAAQLGSKRGPYRKRDQLPPE